MVEAISCLELALNVKEFSSPQVFENSSVDLPLTFQELTILKVSSSIVVFNTFNNVLYQIVLVFNCLSLDRDVMSSFKPSGCSQNSQVLMVIDYS